MQINIDVNLSIIIYIIVIYLHLQWISLMKICPSFFIEVKDQEGNCYFYLYYEKAPPVLRKAPNSNDILTLMRFLLQYFPSVTWPGTGW